MYNPPTAPLSIGGVLDDGFRLLQACFTKVFPLALLYSIASVGPNWMMPTPSPGAMPEWSAGLGAAFLLAWALGLVFFTALVASVEAIAKRSQLSMGAALGLGLRRFFPLLACLVLFTLALLVGFVVFVVPGLILMVSLSMAPYLVIIEGMGPYQALKASHRLVWGNWWRTATILTVVLFITLTAYMLVGLLSGISASMGMGDSGGGSLVYLAVAALISAVIIPLYYAFGLAVLHDLQLRKLGGDLDQRIGAIEGA
jgi:hypothetical protein